MHSNIYHQNASIVSYETWIGALASSACIGFTSLVPWLFNMTFFEHRKKQHAGVKLQNEDNRMKYLLSFAIGAILGDIFFHLIPESYHSHIVELNDSKETAHKKVGLSVIAGIFMFIIVEMVLEKWSNSIKEKNDKHKLLQEARREITREVEKKKSSAIKNNAFKHNNHQQKLHQRNCKNLSDNQQATNVHKKDLKQAIGAIINQPVMNVFEKTLENNNNNLIVEDLNSNFHANIKQSIELERLSSKNSNLLLNNNNNIVVQSNNRTQLRSRIKMSSNNNNNNEQMKSKEENSTCFDFMIDDDKREKIIDDKEEKIENNSSLNEFTSDNVRCCEKGTSSDDDNKMVEVAGYLSLIANGFDNFTHGLAIGASFLVGPKVGLLTTFVIFIHEIPHEICDYAILVNSGFSRWDAVKAQSSVSLFGILGTATALYVKSLETLTAKTVWILPFSAGGFLYIALVNLLPEILDHKTNLKNSTGQVASVILGITFMALVAII